MEEIYFIGVINFFILLVAFLLFAFKNKIKNNVSKEKREFFDEILNCFKLKFFPKQIIFSVLIVLITNLAIILLHGSFWNPPNKEIFGLILFSFITPISEEFLLRGALLGVVFFFLIPFLFKIRLDFKKFRYTSILYYMFSLLCVSLYFALIHKNPELINFIIRLSGGIIFGGLYLIYDKNLLPPIIAHITHNLLISEGFFSGNFLN